MFSSQSLPTTRLNLTISSALFQARANSPSFNPNSLLHKIPNATSKYRCAISSFIYPHQPVHAMEQKEVWADWVSLCPSTVPSKWKPKYLRLSTSKLEYFDSNPTPIGTTSPSVAPSLHNLTPVPLHDSSTDNTSQSPPANTLKPVDSSTHSQPPDSAISAAEDSKASPQGSPKKEQGQPPKQVSAAEGDATEIPKRASSVSFSQGSLPLDSIAGFCLLGSDHASEVAPFPLAQFHVDQGSRSHRLFHSGKPMLLVICNAGEAPRIWRIRFDEMGALQTFVACVEHAMDGVIVRAAGWLHAAGKLNWNRRYCVLLSTGNLLVFRDSTLEELRRNIPLGVSSTIHAVTDEEEDPAALLAKVKSGVKFEVLLIKILSPHIPEKKGYGFCVDAGHDATPQALLCLHKQWLR